MLRIDDLSISFRRYDGLLSRRLVPCVHGATLGASAGEMVAVIGASGAGKSLIAHAIVGILPGNAVVFGTIALDGEPLSPARTMALRGRAMALVPQSIACLDPLATCGRQVRWAAQRAGRDPANGVGALARYGLSERVETAYPHALSGGMARRVLLSIATVGDARLIVADEPTTGLDPDNAGIVLQYLRDLADRGKAVLVITHDLAAALPFADRVVVMRGGRTVETAAADTFRDDGAEALPPYARDLWHALPSNGFAL